MHYGAVGTAGVEGGGWRQSTNTCCGGVGTAEVEGIVMEGGG